jgi:glucose-1-phosphate thymidylyltransferase
MSFATTRRIVGLIPAAGRATRLGSIPHSKEVQPIGSYPDPQGGGARPKVVSHYLLEKMRAAGISEAYIILREGKWDIPAHFKDGAIVGLHLGYLIVTVPYGAPYTLDQAYPFVRDSLVALGFPDILFAGHDAFARVIAHQAASGADVVLGLFPTDQPHAVDMVAVDAGGRVATITPKPARTTLTHTWGIAAWTPAFTELMHHYLAERPVPTRHERELFVGDVMQEGINRGLNVQGVYISDTSYIDIGTPENLARVLQEGPPR